MIARTAFWDLAPMRRHPVVAALAGAAGVGIATLVALPLSRAGHAVPALVLVLPVIGTALLGGRIPSLAVAAVAGLALATVFLPPVGTPRVRVADDALALVVFLVVGVSVSALLGLVLDAERRRRAADEARLLLLEQTDEQRRALLRAVSHELRTPLGVVHGAAAELIDGASLYGEAARRQLLALVVDETSRLERIVSNLLAMSRIEAGSWEPATEPVDVVALARTVVDRFAIESREVAVTLDAAPDVPLVSGDPVQIELVLVNLVENAARQARDGVVGVVVDRAGDRARIEVVDRGTVVPAELVDRVFEPFVTGPGGTTTGIGLALCRTVVGEHGGSIRLESDPVEEVTTVIVELPAL